MVSCRVFNAHARNAHLARFVDHWPRSCTASGSPALLFLDRAGELVLLCNWSTVNSLSLSKILKKHDKVTKLALKQAYLASALQQVTASACMSRSDLLPGPPLCIGTATCLWWTPLLYGHTYLNRCLLGMLSQPFYSTKGITGLIASVEQMLQPLSAHAAAADAGASAALSEAGAGATTQTAAGGSATEALEVAVRGSSQADATAAANEEVGGSSPSVSVGGASPAASDTSQVLVVRLWPKCCLHAPASAVGGSLWMSTQGFCSFVSASHSRTIRFLQPQVAAALLLACRQSWTSGSALSGRCQCGSSCRRQQRRLALWSHRIHPQPNGADCKSLRRCEEARVVPCRFHLVYHGTYLMYTGMQETGVF